MPHDIFLMPFLKTGDDELILDGFSNILIVHILVKKMVGSGHQSGPFHPTTTSEETRPKNIF